MCKEIPTVCTIAVSSIQGSQNYGLVVIKPPLVTKRHEILGHDRCTKTPTTVSEIANAENIGRTSASKHTCRQLLVQIRE